MKDKKCIKGGYKTMCNEKDCDCHKDILKESVMEEVPKMSFIFEDEASYHNLAMFREVQSRIDFEENMTLFIFFGMGSIQLDIMNVMNHITVYPDYMEIYNNDNQELTFLKNSEVVGFVFEPNNPVTMEEEGDVEE